MASPDNTCVASVFLIVLALGMWIIESPASARRASEDAADPVSDSAHPDGDTVLGTRIIEGLFIDRRLWLRGTDGLVSVDLAKGTRAVAFKNGVIDMEVIDEQLWVLRISARTGGHVILSVLADGAFRDASFIETAENDTPIALFDARGHPGVLSPAVIRRFNLSKNSWESTKLKGKVLTGVQISTASPEGSRNVYVGYNRGEWGGGLQKLNARTGELTVIQHDDGNDDEWNGPLLSQGAAITDLRPDPDNSRCIFASTGLAHLFLTRGRVVRVCNDEVSLFFEKRYAEDTFGQGREIEQTEAIFGLGTASGGLWAVSGRALYLLRNGRVLREYALSDLKLEQIDGIRLNREIPGVVIVLTDVNWSVSTSGYTPLIVPVH